MDIVNRHTDAAIRAVSTMSAAPGELWSAAKITRALGLPWPFLRKVLAALKTRGILGSRRGRGGGFFLNRLPVCLTLGEVYEVFQGKPRLTECLFRRRLCGHRATCALRQKILKIEAFAFKELFESTFDELTADAARLAKKPVALNRLP